MTDSKLKIHSCQLDTASILSTDTHTEHVRTDTVCMAHDRGPQSMLSLVVYSMNDRVEVVGHTKNSVIPLSIADWFGSL